MKVIIAGGRDFDDYELLKETCDDVLYALFACKCKCHSREGMKHFKACCRKGIRTGVRIFSGGAKGADKFGETYAQFMAIPFKRFPADWDKYGKSAGYRRNAEMAKEASTLIAFWDGKSRGTKHMIDLARKYKLDVYIKTYQANTT